MLLDIPQRTPQWFDWRGGKDLPDGLPRIMASQIAVVMGLSPFQTAEQLWKELTGRVPSKPANAFMAEGVAREDEARVAYEAQRGEPMAPICAQDDDVPEFGASLDGLSFGADHLLELKVVGEKTHAIALAGTVPPYYYAQMQWQLMCSGAATGDYWSYPRDGQPPVAIPVRPDKAYWDVQREAAMAFRECLRTDTPPAGDKFIDTARRYRLAHALEAQAKRELARCRNDLIAQMPAANKRFAGGGVSLTRGEGAIDVEKFAADRKWTEADIAPFRGEGEIDIERLLIDLGWPADKIAEYRLPGAIDVGALVLSKGVPDEELKSYRAPGSVSVRLLKAS